MSPERPRKPRHAALKALLVLVLALIATDAWATVLYKLTDANGRVTYADSVPLGYNGAVRPLQIDPAEHVAAAPTRLPSARAETEYERIIHRRPDTRSEDRVRQARAKRDAAFQALEDARNNSLAEDWIYFGSRNPAGMRRAPRPEYQARLDELTRNLQRAEEDLQAAERG